MDYIKNEEIAFWKIFFCAYKVDENGEEGIDKIGESIYDDFIKKFGRIGHIVNIRGIRNVNRMVIKRNLPFI